MNNKKVLRGRKKGVKLKPTRLTHPVNLLPETIEKIKKYCELNGCFAYVPVEKALEEFFKDNI